MRILSHEQISKADAIASTTVSDLVTSNCPLDDDEFVGASIPYNARVTKRRKLTRKNILSKEERTVITSATSKKFSIGIKFRAIDLSNSTSEDRTEIIEFSLKETEELYEEDEITEDISILYNIPYGYGYIRRERESREVAAFEFEVTGVFDADIDMYVSPDQIKKAPSVEVDPATSRLLTFTAAHFGFTIKQRFSDFASEEDRTIKFTVQTDQDRRITSVSYIPIKLKAGEGPCKL